MTTGHQCPCGSGNDYSICCGVYLSGAKIPATPEQLMRSRYTAYTQADVNYIAKTMTSPAADDFNAEESRAWAEKVEWLGLDVIASNVEGDKGFVEFYALMKIGKEKHAMHERSEFHLQNGQWVYVDGIDPCGHEHNNHHDHEHQHARPTVGRNDPCPCGSGKKYKKCCIDI